MILTKLSPYEVVRTREVLEKIVSLCGSRPASCTAALWMNTVFQMKIHHCDQTTLLQSEEGIGPWFH